SCKYMENMNKSMQVLPDRSQKSEEEVPVDGVVQDNIIEEGNRDEGFDKLQRKMGQKAKRKSGSEWSRQKRILEYSRQIGKGRKGGNTVFKGAKKPSFTAKEVHGIEQ
ncbi:hypothetical protein P7K49_029015, partial [Saguinus oedipus]